MRAVQPQPWAAVSNLGTPLLTLSPGQLVVMLYNLPQHTVLYSQPMPKLRHRWSWRRRWRQAVIPLVICSLTISLATRFCVQVTSSVHVSKTIERRSVEPKRQHLNRDAMQWATPVAISTFLTPVTLYTRVAPAGTAIPSHTLDESLYNRPPPSEFIL